MLDENQCLVFVDDCWVPNCVCSTQSKAMTTEANNYQSSVSEQSSHITSGMKCLSKPTYHSFLDAASPKEPIGMLNVPQPQLGGQNFEVSNSAPKTQKIGTYFIEKTIGKGNFSVVKLATHSITQIKVAIKIIDKTRLSKENLRKAQREVDILKSLQHPNIIKLYQVMQTSKLLYIVMEYLPNGELFEFIAKHGRLTEEAARHKFLEILAAIEHCHQNRVVHRDLKAENMLLDQSMTIKLADFGFGTFQADGPFCLLRTWCGSPPYAAPEIFKGEPYIGVKADIWSLGVLLYVLVIGILPFNATELPQLRDQVLNANVRIPYWLSLECEDLLRGMMAKLPGRRLAISQIRRHKWFDSLNQTAKVIPGMSSDSLPSSSAICESAVNAQSVDFSATEPLAMAITSPRPPFTRMSLIANTGANLAAEMKMGKLNQLVIQIMESNGMRREQILESLGRCAYDHLTATYLLLGEQLRLHRRSLPHTLAPSVTHLKTATDPGEELSDGYDINPHLPHASPSSNTLSTTGKYESNHVGHSVRPYPKLHNPDKHDRSMGRQRHLLRRQVCGDAAPFVRVDQPPTSSFLSASVTTSSETAASLPGTPPIPFATTRQDLDVPTMHFPTSPCKSLQVGSFPLQRHMQRLHLTMSQGPRRLHQQVRPLNVFPTTNTNLLDVSTSSGWCHTAERGGFIGAASPQQDALGSTPLHKDSTDSSDTHQEYGSYALADSHFHPVTAAYDIARPSTIFWVDEHNSRLVPQLSTSYEEEPAWYAPKLSCSMPLKAMPVAISRHVSKASAYETQTSGLGSSVEADSLHSNIGYGPALASVNVNHLEGEDVEMFDSRTLPCSLPPTVSMGYLSSGNNSAIPLSTTATFNTNLSQLTLSPTACGTPPDASWIIRRKHGVVTRPNGLQQYCDQLKEGEFDLRCACEPIDEYLSSN